MLFIFIAQLHHIVAAVVSEPAADQLAQAVVAVVAAQEKREVVTFATLVCGRRPSFVI